MDKGTSAPAVAAPTKISPEIIEKLVIDGDLGRLSNIQRIQYYHHRCMTLGLDPAEHPFALLKLKGSVVLYARKQCTDALSRNNKVSRQVISSDKVGASYVVRVRATTPDGRFDEDVGVVDITGLAGENLANAMMRATTKAKRRAVLGLFGVGVIDESELDSVEHDFDVPQIVIDQEVRESDARMRSENLLRELVADVKDLKKEIGESGTSWRGILEEARDGKAWPSSDVPDEHLEEAIEGLKMMKERLFLRSDYRGEESSC